MLNYELRNRVAIVSFDDGKANAVGHAFLDAVNDALDQAEKDEAAALVLRGRDGVFSGGFDLKEFSEGADAGVSMVKRGMELLIRLYSFPLPVVAAVTGHAVAMGAFVVLACDTRIGAAGRFKVTLPETALGMDLPPTMAALTASRVSPRFMTRAIVQSEVFDPELAVMAGFLDEVVDVAALDARALEVAQQLAQLPQQQYAGNKRLARKHALSTMQDEFDRMVSLLEQTG